MTAIGGESSPSGAERFEWDVRAREIMRWIPVFGVDSLTWAEQSIRKMQDSIMKRETIPSRRMIMSEIIKREGKEFTSSDDVLSFLGADRCRLVYRLVREKNVEGHGERARVRAKGTPLFLLDYTRSKPYPIVYEYPDDSAYKSFTPLLSPDGTRILYNHSFDATDIMILPVEGSCPVKIGVGANPRWCLDNDSGNTYVIYRERNAKYNSAPQDGITFRLQIDENNKSIGEPEIVASYGFSGGMSTDGRYLCTAFLLASSMDRKTGAVSAPLGTVLQQPDCRNQCCCPSIAPDDTGRMMVLRWPHERFSVMGWDGSDMIHYPMPEGAAEWQTPEWSTHPDFATSSVMFSNELIYDIMMINLSTKEYLQITTDGGYVHAHLWIG